MMKKLVQGLVGLVVLMLLVGGGGYVYLSIPPSAPEVVVRVDQDTNVVEIDIPPLRDGVNRIVQVQNVTAGTQAPAPQAFLDGSSRYTLHPPAGIGCEWYQLDLSWSKTSKVFGLSIESAEGSTEHTVGSCPQPSK